MEKLRNAVNAMFSEPFVLATGIAALLHSTWSLAMMFSGAIPNAQTQPLQWVGTMLPAFLLAFSIDVGQIMTSRDIRRGMRNAGKILTFVALALATYYLQWMFMIAHVPELALGTGVSAKARDTVLALRDASIWIIPALLPIATTLYTISNADKRIAAQVQRDERNAARRLQQRTMHPVMHPVLTATKAPSGSSGGTFTDELADAVHENADETYTGICPFCDYETQPKGSERAAKAALAAHKRKCVGVHITAPNGNGVH